MANAYLTCSSHISKDNLVVYDVDFAIVDFFQGYALFSRSERKYLVSNMHKVNKISNRLENEVTPQ